MTNKKKEPKYEDGLSPSKECDTCDGRGEVKDQLVGFLSSYWTYKKCKNCNGTGKNIWMCMWCDKGVITSEFCGFWCPNLNCDKYALKVALAIKQDS